MKISSKETGLSIQAGLLAFIIYTCMYAIRKPYTALLYDNQTWFGEPLKVWFVVAQIFGYAISKWAGIRIIGGLKSKQRAFLMLSLLFVATVPLLLLPYVPNGIKILCFLANGFPLGLIFGIVFSWIEGRKLTEFMGAILACTFIFSSGLVKSLGLQLIEKTGWTEMELPGYLGLMAFVIAVPFTLLITKIPAPNENDVAMRNLRLPLNKSQRIKLIKKYILPITLWISAYFILTLIRDVRDNFSVEMLREGGNFDRSIFTKLETPISLIMLVLVSLLALITNHRKAMKTIGIVSIVGLMITLFSTFLWLSGEMSTVFWLFFTGIGVYFGYILMNISLFERFIAYTGSAANAGFLLYMADAWGYMGSVGITIAKQMVSIKVLWTQWYSVICIVGSVIAIACFLIVESKFFGHRNKIKIQNEQ